MRLVQLSDQAVKDSVGVRVTHDHLTGRLGSISRAGEKRFAIEEKSVG